MARKMVGKRPGLMIAIGVKSAKPMGHAEPESDAEEMAESPAEEQREEETGEEKLPPHEVLCKVCNTVIDTDTGEPVEDAKNAQDAKANGRKLPPIPTRDEMGPPPSRFGEAYDAANGENAISKALQLLGGKR
jgi:hypothetical protein